MSDHDLLYLIGGVIAGLWWGWMARHCECECEEDETEDDE